MRTCKKCGEAKPLTEFYKHAASRDGYRVRCKPCVDVDNKQSREAHIDRHRAYARAYRKRWREANPEREAVNSRRASLRMLYGMEFDEYDRLFKEQGGVCAICRGACSSGKRLSVDHDHETGANRGLLCTRCNGGLGRFDDDPGRFQTAAAYLDKYAPRGAVSPDRRA